MKVNEIFTSFSGEVGLFPQGTAVQFIRFPGCNLRCTFCDTKQTWDSDNGSEFNLEELLDRLEASSLRRVVITGGEPLLQGRQLGDLIEILISVGYKIQIETNGTMLPSGKILCADCFVFDYKPLSCGIEEHASMMSPDMFAKAPSGSWIKAPYMNRHDLAQAIIFIKEVLQYRDPSDLNVAISPVFGKDGSLLCGFDPLGMLDSAGLLEHVVMNIQIHKIGNFS